MDKHWVLDGWIDITGVCEDEGWHLASAIKTLVDLGVEYRDAEAYADFAFHEKAVVKREDGGVLTPEQRQRLRAE
ncbi:MAG TPA: hypothetical protein PLJ71_08115 [Candidatus Hydrogenedentes bacterium]|nr:hypothetical protein [Candidatus Hydrogenedentota bacterium]